MTHQELIELAPAYALGALDAGDTPGFEAHLLECATCRAEVTSYRETAALFGHAVTVRTPFNASDLRKRIVTSASTVRAVTSARSAVARGQRGVRPVWLAAAACLVVAALSGVAWRRERERVAALGAQLALTRADLATRDSVLAAFMGSEVHVVSLTQADNKPQARVFWNHTRHLFIVTAFSVPRAPAGKTYQLWALRNGKPPLSMGTFNTDASGRGTAVLAVAQGITDGGFIDNCGLTLEPDGGSAQPSETPRLLGAWRHVD